jgi:hypothetical protein
MSIVIDVVVLVLLMRAQVQAKPLSGYTLPLVLLVIGVLEVAAFFVGSGQQLAEILKGQRSFAMTVPASKTVIVALVGSLAIAFVSGAIRAPTFQLWRQDGQCWRKGSAVTVALWIASLGVHLLYDAVLARRSALSGLGAATLVLYFGVSLSIQRLFLAARASRIAADNGPPGSPPTGQTR